MRDLGSCPALAQRCLRGPSPTAGLPSVERANPHHRTGLGPLLSTAAPCACAEVISVNLVFHFLLLDQTEGKMQSQ